jgi:hypothetical protein
MPDDRGRTRDHGPAQLAKTLAAIGLLSGGRLVAGGSAPADYTAAGVPFILDPNLPSWLQNPPHGRA